MPAYIATNLDDLTDGNFTIAVNNINTAMTNNSDFPSPPTPMSDVNKIFEGYKALSKERYQMSPKDTENRNDLRKKLGKMLRGNGLYVIALFSDDKDKQISSQYPPVKAKNDSGEPDKPTSIKAKNGSNSGEALLNWQGSKIAKGYNLKYRTMGDEGPWAYKPVTKSKGVIFAGLTPGEVYEFWVQAIGSKKDSDFNGPAELRVI